MDAIEQALLDLQTDQKSLFAKWEAKADAEFQKTGTVTSELREQMDRLEKRYDEIEVKRATSAAGQKTVWDSLKEDEQLQRLMKDKNGTIRLKLDAKQSNELFEGKTLLTTTSGGGYASGGVFPIDRDPGVVFEARRELRMRDVIPARRTNFGKVYWVKVSAPMTKASPVAEGSTKPDNQIVLTTVGEQLRTIATMITVTRQAIEDWDELQGILETSLRYEVDKEDDNQILNGDGTGENYNGLITQATAYSAALTGSGAYNKADQLGRALQQVQRGNEVMPSFVVMHPDDWWGVRLIKDNNGNYIFGSPATMGNPGVWGLTPIVTTAIATGKFLIGPSNAVAAEIRDGFGTEIELSTQHANNFSENKVSIRSERRSLLTVKRPGSLIYGTFSTSPAS
jgi:HK97 family phage major capsid protein